MPVSLAPIAQLVEQLPLKEMVLGSNPSGRTKDATTCLAAGFALGASRSHVLQLQDGEAGSRANFLTRKFDL